MAQGVLDGHPSSDGALILSINGALDPPAPVKPGAVLFS